MTEAVRLKRVHKGYRKALYNITSKLLHEASYADGDYQKGLMLALDIVVAEREGINWLIQCLYDGE